MYLGGVLTLNGVPVIRITKRDGTVLYVQLDRIDYRPAASLYWHMSGGKGAVGKYATSSSGEYLHRWVARRAGLLTEDTPTSAEVDHINGDKLDNRRGNLRLLKRPDNMRNPNDGLRTTNRSGHRGVSFVKSRERFGKPWMAYVTVNYKTHNLGWYSTVEAAAEARRLWDAQNRPG